MREYIEEIKKFLNNIYLFHNPFNSATYVNERYIDKIGKIMYAYDQMIDESVTYSLNRKKINQRIIAPPILRGNEIRKIDLNSIEQIHSKEVLNFIDTLESVFSEELLSNLYSNLKNIKFDYGTQKKSSTIGTYNPANNSILIDKSITDEKLKHTINHELFHMASTSKQNDTTYCGFHYSGLGYNIGRALNEGYTEIMTNRYFGNEEDFNSGYTREINYATAIEDIVGKEAMEKFYMTGNLYGLINELKKYAPEKEIIDFIMKTDDLFYSKEKTHTNLHHKLNSYKELERQDEEKNEIEVNLFLASLKLKKNNERDLATEILKQNNQCDLYTINGNEIGKNIYMECLTLFNTNNASDCLKQLFDAIGYDKLKDICFVSGISGLIDELKKYSSLEDINKYFKLLDSNLDKNIDDDTYKNEVSRYLSILYNYPLAISAIKNELQNNSSIKATINSGFRINNDYSASFLDKGYFFQEYQSYIKSRNEFNSKKITNDEYNELIEYRYSLIVKIENLIGKNKLLEMFVLSDTNSVINELSKYFTKDQVDRIINTSWMDAVMNNTFGNVGQNVNVDDSFKTI